MPTGPPRGKRFEDRVFRKAGWISPVVLVNGAVAGVWEHEKIGSRIEVTIHPLRKFASAQKKQIREEADRLGHFLEGRATVSYGS